VPLSSSLDLSGDSFQFGKATSYLSSRWLCSGHQPCSAARTVTGTIAGTLMIGLINNG
jgi:hypothetical protein